MSLGRLYREIILDEEMCTRYLKDKGVLPNQPVTCSKVREDEVCGGELKECLRKSKKRDANGEFIKAVYLRCSKRGCQTFYSLRGTNKFFTYSDVSGKCNSKLSFCQIVELVWMWCNLVSNSDCERWTGRGNHTITDWYNMCRDVCVDMYGKRSKMGGVGLVVQIDESLFQGKRKYNRGRLLASDRRRHETVPVSDSDSSDCENEPTNGESSAQNYGQRVQGPWVFGMCCNKDGVLERRFFVVERRDRATLLPIILNEIEQGSSVHSDCWRAYSTLADHGYTHHTVNHSENFVDPTTGAHTQTIESLWRHVKLKYKIKHCGATKLLERQLMEEWWRSVNAGKDLLDSFFNDMKTTFLVA